MPFQKSQFFLLQIIEWLIPLHHAGCSTTHGYICFELPAFNALDDATVQGRLDNVYRVKNVTFEVTSFRVNQRQTRLISGLLQQVLYRTEGNKLSNKPM